MPVVSEELIQRVQKGDKDAFGQIYKLFHKKIYRFIYFSLRNHELAEDLTQEAFLRLWKSFSSFSSSKGTVQALVYKIARNLVIDWQRKKKSVSLELFYDSLQDSKDFEEDIRKRENVMIIQHVLSKLNSLEKDIIILRYFEELPFSKIAEITSKKEGAIRVRLHRVLKKMKYYLEDRI